jgi:hypothetical protein
MFAVLNVDTGDFYSESPALKKEAIRTGSRWNNTSVLPAFACRFTRYQDALRRSQKLSNKTHGVCAVVILK